MSTDPYFIDILRRKAKAAARESSTGVANFDKVSIAYYPVSNRYSWFLGGHAVSKREAVTWLTRRNTNEETE